MSSNLPPGCSVGDIPGNRQEDAAWESFLEDIDKRYPKLDRLDVLMAYLMWKDTSAITWEALKEFSGWENIYEMFNFISAELDREDPCDFTNTKNMIDDWCNRND